MSHASARQTPHVSCQKPTKALSPSPRSTLSQNHCYPLLPTFHFPASLQILANFRFPTLHAVLRHLCRWRTLAYTYFVTDLPLLATTPNPSISAVPLHLIWHEGHISDFLQQEAQSTAQSTRNHRWHICRALRGEHFCL